MKPIIYIFILFLLSGAVDNNRARQANKAYHDGNYQQAEKYYREILRDHPDAPEILFNLGNSLARQGKSDESAEVFRRFQELVPEPVQRALAEYNLGYLYTDKGNYREALRYFQDAMKLDPQDEDAKFNYELLRRRQMESPDPDTGEDEQQEEQPQQQDGQAPQSPQQRSDEDEDQTDESPPSDRDGQPLSEEDHHDGSRPEISNEQLDHAEDIMNALEQIEKDLIRDFIRRQFDPAQPTDKDW